MPELFPLRGRKVWVAGHRGMAGSAIVRRLARADCQILTASRAQLDLARQADVEAWLDQNRPDAVFLAAGTVGGIAANAERPAEFLYDNIILAANVIHAAARTGTPKLLYMGSSCVYPKFAPQPIVEASLLTGALEPTNEAYALAKIAGIKLCDAYRQQHGCDFVSAMPCNLMGPGDSFDPDSSHVVAALIRKIAQARRDGRDSVELWGTGAPRREFMFVDDMADALVFLMENYSAPGPVNVGTGQDITIHELAEKLAALAGWQGRFTFNTAMPDGTPRKVMNVSRLAALGWTAPTPLDDGLAAAWHWYVQNVKSR